MVVSELSTWSGGRVLLGQTAAKDAPHIFEILPLNACSITVRSLPNDHSLLNFQLIPHGALLSQSDCLQVSEHFRVSKE